MGDKFGTIHLFDVSRKLVLDKKQLFEVPRRILNITTATLAWVETKLTYISVITRGNPYIKLLCFKHNENKLYLLYNINLCPHLPNPDNLESNPEQSYLELPAEAKISFDCLFMSVTSFNGDVRIIKLPPIINPLKEEEPL